VLNPQRRKGTPHPHATHKPHRLSHRTVRPQSKHPIACCVRRGHAPARCTDRSTGSRRPPEGSTPPARSVTGTRAMARIPLWRRAAVACGPRCMSPRRGGPAAAADGGRVRARWGSTVRGPCPLGGRRSVSAGRSTRCDRPLCSSACAAASFLLEQHEGFQSSTRATRQLAVFVVQCRTTICIVLFFYLYINYYYHVERC
jgi:hypothetical protein